MGILVVSWLVCENFEFRAKNGSKLPRNSQKMLMKSGTKHLPPLIRPKNDFFVFLGNCFGVFEKNLLLHTSCSAQNGHFGLLRGCFWPKNLENKLFSVRTIKKKQMWLPKFLVPQTSPWPPYTPPDIPRPGVWGGPKCIPSSPMMIVNAKQAIFFFGGGV